MFFGVPVWTRTRNPLLRRQMLYPIELPGQILFNYPIAIAILMESTNFYKFNMPSIRT